MPLVHVGLGESVQAFACFLMKTLIVPDLWPAHCENTDCGCCFNAALSKGHSHYLFLSSIIKYNVATLFLTY